jgi:hypothetical protein
MGKLSKDKKESLDRLNDQLILAKSTGNTKLFKIIQKVIQRIKNQDEE